MDTSVYRPGGAHRPDRASGDALCHLRETHWKRAILFTARLHYSIKRTGNAGTEQCSLHCLPGWIVACKRRALAHRITLTDYRLARRSIFIIAIGVGSFHSAPTLAGLSLSIALLSLYAPISGTCVRHPGPAHPDMLFLWAGTLAALR